MKRSNQGLAILAIAGLLLGPQAIPVEAGHGWGRASNACGNGGYYSARVQDGSWGRRSTTWRQPYRVATPHVVSSGNPCGGASYGVVNHGSNRVYGSPSTNVTPSSSMRSSGGRSMSSGPPPVPTPPGLNTPPDVPAPPLPGGRLDSGSPPTDSRPRSNTSEPPANDAAIHSPLRYEHSS